VATVAYDIRPVILADFSTERRKAYEAMQRLRIAGFSESNLYDAMVDTVDRMSRIEGRKTNQSRDGKFRKISVDLVNPATNEPLRVVDEKGKPIKYTIVAKAGYTAPNEVE